MMVLRFIGWKVKGQLLEWLPFVQFTFIVLNFLSLVVGAIAVIVALQGYSDGRYPPVAIDAVVKCIVIFLITFTGWIPLILDWIKDKQKEYQDWKLTVGKKDGR